MLPVAEYVGYLVRMELRDGEIVHGLLTLAENGKYFIIHSHSMKSKRFDGVVVSEDEIDEFYPLKKYALFQKTTNTSEISGEK